MIKKTKLIITFIALTAVSACISTTKVKGFKHRPDVIARLEIGKTTENDVTNLLGSPTLKSEFGDNTWYYVSSTEKVNTFTNPKKVEQFILSVEFNSDHVISNIKEYNLADAKDVEISYDRSITKGHDSNELRDFIHNIGKFNKTIPVKK